MLLAVFFMVIEKYQKLMTMNMMNRLVICPEGNIKIEQFIRVTFLIPRLYLTLCWKHIMSSLGPRSNAALGCIIK